MRFRARRFDTREVAVIETSGDRIGDVRVAPAAGDFPWVAPGLVDLQVNGLGGLELTDIGLTVEQVVRVSQSLDAFGVTAYCPTVTTHSFEVLSHSLATIAAAAETSAAASQRIAGIHLEGPYLSREEGPRGAHPARFCRPPDWDEFQRFQEAAGGRIRILTLAPEYEGAPAFIERVVASGVLVAIGHTGADASQIRAAVDAGARMSTHLGNGAHALIRRHPNYIWDQLAEDRLVASLIADGHHLPASVVKCFVRAKTAQRCVLVSDVVGMAGMPPGRYENTRVGDVEILEDGRLVVAGQRQYLAGATLPLTQGVANVMRFAGLDLKAAVEMASLQPASLVGQRDLGIAAGARADLILFELPRDDSSPIRIQATIQRGQLVYGALPQDEVRT